MECYLWNTLFEVSVLVFPKTISSLLKLKTDSAISSLLKLKTFSCCILSFDRCTVFYELSSSIYDFFSYRVIAEFFFYCLSF